MRHFEEREADAILKGIDGPARLASIGGIEIRRGGTPRCAIKLLQMRDGKLFLTRVRFARAFGTIGAVMYRIENLCPPQIAVFFTLQPPIKRGNRFASKKAVNHMAENSNRVPCVSPKRHLDRYRSSIEK
jgi:hypothetical protein